MVKGWPWQLAGTEANRCSGRRFGNERSLCLTHESRASIMQAAAPCYKAAETGLIMWLGTVWKYASAYMLYLESGARADVSSQPLQQRGKTSTLILYMGEHRDHLLNWNVSGSPPGCKCVHIWRCDGTRGKGGKRLCCSWYMTAERCMCVCVCYVYACV